MLPTTYPATFPPINPATVPAPPYPPPSRRHIPSDSTSSVQVGSTLMNIPMKSAPAVAPVPILQPQPQKRISMPSIINHVQGDTPPPLQRHRQGQGEESGELQEQKYQIPSPAFSAAHQPLQPYDPVVAYPSSTAGEARGNVDNASSAPHDSERFDRGTTSGDYYTSPYQAFMPSAASGLMVVPHTVAHERNGTVYYNYEYSCDTSTPSFPYQQQQQQTQTVEMQHSPLPDPSAQLYQHAVPPPSSGHFLPMYHPLNSTGYNMPPLPPGPSTAGGFPQFRYSTPVTQGHYGLQPIYSHSSHMQSIPISMPMNMAMQHPMAAVPGSMQSQPAHMHTMSSKNGS
ncbi:hypothetical protein KEM56_002184 [Ascosphaera pollenicola]|nr:hypothetical protein KEM56_002184 [Ascosphaera pollenicola]